MNRNINPNERTFIKNSAYSLAAQTLSENESKLIELLEGKEKKLLLDLVNAQSIVDGITAVDIFIKGFRLGDRIAIEVMSDEDGCLREIT
ncbi:MAG: DUF6809 family protein [Oscillospiraceae bacterium]